nr:MBL fold metallo-hydrolase [Clostridium swellfunianum]
MIITLIFILIFGYRVDAETNKYEVHFIDTGQSDCILIKGPDKSYLIDTGFEGSYENISNYIKSRGVSKLEEVIITHYHDDHYGSLEKLVKNDLVKKVVLPRHQEKYRELVFSYLNDRDVEVEYINENFVIKNEGINIKALLPKKEDMEIENNNGTVLVGTIDNVKYAFMADVELDREKSLVKEKELINADIVKVPHHGLDTSSAEGLVRVLNPRAVIITCDGRESPSREILNRYENYKTAIFRTDMNGNILVKAKPENKEIEIITSKVIQ